MNAEDELLVRREVRTAVFRTNMLRRAGRAVEADEQLSGELAAAQARLAALGHHDAVGTLRCWRMEDEAAYDYALLIADLVAPQSASAPTPAAVAAPPRSGVEPSSPATVPLAFPPPPTGVPGLADLLDDMLSQERRSRPRPP
jgi:hypothetical protein